MVAAAPEKLPPEIRELARAVPVLIPAEPDASMLAEGFAAALLGLFTGALDGAEVLHYQPAKAHILLYLSRLWDYAAGEAATLRAEVPRTARHERGPSGRWKEDQRADRGLD